MYKLTVFTYKLSKQDELDRIRACLAILETSGKILNIPNHKVEDHVTSNSVVIGFGSKVNSMISQYLQETKLVNIKHIQLPGPEQLSPIEKNKVARQKAFDQLQDIKSLLKEDLFQPVLEKEIKEEDLPALDAKHILLLEKITEESGFTSCFQVSKSGKLVEIANQKLEKSRADIHLTFAELYTLRCLMDTLQIEEVKIVSYPKGDSS